MRKWEYSSVKIIEELGGEEIGKLKKVTINDVTTIDLPRDNCLMFASYKKWDDSKADLLKEIKNSFIIIDEPLKKIFKKFSNFNSVIVVKNSRMYFAKALYKILDEQNRVSSYHYVEYFVTVGENVEIGNGCIFEPFVFIDHNVKVGNNVYIKTGTKIRQNVEIADNVFIGENSVIGAQGFGIEKDSDGKAVRIPHVGGVVIGSGTQIGALTSIVAGTILPTTIGDNCFIDDLSHIAHNCVIGDGTFITGCTEIGGSAKIGSNGYVAPNTTIRNGINLGDNCFIGQASSVQRSFGDNLSIVGSPAKEFKR